MRRANRLNPLKYYFEVREISIRSGGLNFEISLLNLDDNMSKNQEKYHYGTADTDPQSHFQS